MKPYSYVEGGPSADLTVEAHGSTLNEVFGNVALAMFNAMTPIDGVEAHELRIVQATGDDLGGLLYNFLDELLYVHDVELLVFSSITVSIDEGNLQLTAECLGEHFAPKRHESGIVVKAVTFHQMEIERKKYGYSLRVVFDT
jgi:SHS2 domain-containing protein